MSPTTIQEIDEELEKFIQKKFDLNCIDVPDDDWNHYVVREEDFKRAAIDIADFAARRAREKAIEECVAKLKEVLYSEERYIVDEFDINAETIKALEELKSTTN